MTIRQSVAIAIVSDTVHVIVGGILMLAGIFGAIYQIEHPPVVKWVFYPMLGLAVLGAAILPTVLPVFKQIIVVITPFIPMFGGRRAGDPPVPPSPPKP